MIRVTLAVKGKNNEQKASFKLGAGSKFQLRTWYLITLTHSSHFMRGSEITLYVNGRKAGASPLVYPKFDEVRVVSCVAHATRLLIRFIYIYQYAGTFFVYCGHTHCEPE